jgi:IS5 family transposase
VTQANGRAEPLAALVMIEARADRPVAVTLDADKGYDAPDFVNELRSLNMRPLVAQNTSRRHGRSAIDGRTTRHPGCEASQRVRKRIEEAFGSMKTIAGMRRPMLRGVDRMGWAFTFAAAAYNLVCLPRLLAEPG